MHFASVLDALPQQVWKADAQGRLLWMNARLAEALNRPALPVALAQCLHEDDRAAFEERWRAAQAAGRFEMEYRVGSHWMLAQAQRLPDSPLWLGTHTDIAGRRAAENRLHEADAIWKLALESSGDGVWDWHVQAGVEYFSERYLRLYGFEPGDVDATPEAFDARTHPDDLAQMAQDRDDHFAGRTPLYRNEHRVLSKDGQWKWILSRGMVIARDTAGRPLRMVGTHTDITERKRQETLVWQQARVDALTGLPNRRALRERIERALAQRTVRGEELAVLFVDLDHFKEVNDSLGHDVGDALLVQVAERLQGCMPDGSGVVARMGGDEFTVLLTAAQAAPQAERIGHQLLEALSEAFQVAGERVYVSASIGVSLAPRDGLEIEALFKHADLALYEAKGAGRNRMAMFTPALHDAAQRRARLAGELREALRLQQFSLVYQPILSLRDPTAAPRKAEALLRWRHPQLGDVSPAQFIPIAETSGLIVDIGDWVFREAAAQALAWREAGHGGFQISINKSPVQFLSERSHRMQPDWISHLRSLGLGGDALAVEITEGLLLERDEAVAERLRALRDAGLAISLDDFGTGYSSLSYLQHHDIDTVKIDRSFVAGLENGGKALALCRAIVTMARELGLEVVAEGVETEAQMVALRDMGCDWGQGWWFGKGVSAGEFEERWFGAATAGSVAATTR
ncbi:EAL domain-containing protein [Roseateles asaccharophilus]|uniref:Diguanylate cyclase (GGDEF)-like protein/PAS domain S-box-containing protein n=1 Tax=Roseateles asaccharophilus TaxID=582607 RepID=A0ABU2AF30_9BURK|nr:EAL domain-containing protein [Roseateles asaccharophilus]MDR7335585.1 diguanylate cyclase (GGDEF)-like protein/PAS domain S-box-containing protein [Roseateles asaccharophilus]